MFDAQNKETFEMDASNKPMEQQIQEEAGHNFSGDETDYVEMSWKDVAMILFFGIGLPTFDVYSDLRFCINYYTLIYDEKTSQVPKEITLIPLISAAISLIPHWWKFEKNTFQRLCTLPLLLLLVWPQYRMVKLLYLGWKKNGNWMNQKITMDRNISHIEPFLEAIPQVHIYLVAWIDNDDKIIGNLQDGFSQESILFLMSFSSSVMSATFGLAKFFKVGPCKFLPTEGFLWGYGHLGFILVLLNITITTFLKGGLLALACAPFVNFQLDAVNAVLIWSSLNYLPQTIYVIVSLSLAIGFKKAISVISWCPSILLTSLYSSFAIGPVKLTPKLDGICTFVYKSKKLAISFNNVWINVFLTSTGCALNYLIYWVYVEIVDEKIMIAKINEYYNSVVILELYIYFKNNVYLMVLLVLLSVNILQIVLIQCIDGCHSWCCICFRSNCLPMIEINILNVDNLGEPQTMEQILCLDVNSEEIQSNYVDIQIVDVPEYENQSIQVIRDLRDATMPKCMDLLYLGEPPHTYILYM